MIRTISIGLLAALFLGAGTLHFVQPETFVRIVPPGFPNPLLLVRISGICEIMGGIGIVLWRTRSLAGWCLIALLVAVFPANVFMALHPEQFWELSSPAMLWWRLPLQPLLMAWVYYAAVRNGASTESGDAANR